MLEATSTQRTTHTRYAVPSNTLLIQDAGGDALIRPTMITVMERDGEILSIGFHGRRQLDGKDARDPGARVIGSAELNDVEQGGEEDLISEALMLHLRSTVTVLTEDETREVLARLA